jgi:hypothetical protein
MDGEERKGQGEEIICSARYSPGRVLLWMMWPLVVIYLSFGLTHLALVKGNLIGAFLWFLIGLFMVLFTLDQLLSEQIILHGDRITKVWRLFGSRTIYYSKAKVKGPAKGTYRIREIGPNGQYLFMQVPIVWIPYLCPSDVSKEGRAILDRLTEPIKPWSDKNERLFKILYFLYFMLLFGVGLFLVWYIT